MRASDLVKILKEQATEPTLIPLEDKVIVMPDEAAKQSAGGIIIPDSAQEAQYRGIVVAVGSHTLGGMPMSVKVGDRVSYSKFAGNDINVDGIDFKCIRHADIALIHARPSENIEQDTEDGSKEYKANAHL